MDQAQSINSRHLEELRVILVALLGHHWHELGPLTSWDFESSNSAETEAEVLHVSYIDLGRASSSQFLQDSIPDIASYPCVELVPEAGSNVGSPS